MVQRSNRAKEYYPGPFLQYDPVTQHAPQPIKTTVCPR